MSPGVERSAKHGSQRTSSGITFQGMQNDWEEIKSLEKRVAWLEKPLIVRAFIKTFRFFKRNGGE